MRSLFCMASNDISGGNKVIRQWMKLLVADGEDVHCYVWDTRRQFSGWSELSIKQHESVESTSECDFDFVFFSNTFLVPIFLPYIGNARPVLMSMAYESFHYGKTYAEAMKDKSSFLKILQLPIAVMSVSRGVQDLLKQRANVESYYVPHGIESHFHPRSLPAFEQNPKRILMVGSYLSPWKGMQDGFEALELLSKEFDLQLVLITQPTISRHIFDKYSFPIEFHCRPALDQVPEIYASCHAHLCASWHEGTGMPTLECMSSGVPVVATKNDGINEFAKDGVNILLAEKHNPADIAAKLKQLLSNRELYDRIREQGIEAMRPYSWEACFDLFKSAESKIFKTLNRPIEANESLMRALLQELEDEGLHTPLHTYVALNSLDRELHALCEQLTNRQLEVSTAVEKLMAIRDEVKPYVANEKTEYYDSFRAAYDLCRLLLSLKDDPQFVDFAASISKRQASAR